MIEYALYIAISVLISCLSKEGPGLFPNNTQHCSDSISLDTFIGQAKQDLSAMKENRNFTDREMIRLVKTYNTSHLSTISDMKIEIVDEFVTVFDEHYYMKVFEQLECRLCKGVSGGYSAKYDIYLSCMTPNCKNFFAVIK